MEKIDAVQGDLKILSMAVIALIDTHPDKESFASRFLEFVQSPALSGEHSADVGNQHSATLLKDILAAGAKR